MAYMWLTVISNSTKRPETIIFNVWRDFGRTGNSILNQENLYALQKRYESTEVDRRSYMCPRNYAAFLLEQIRLSIKGSSSAKSDVNHDKAWKRIGLNK